MDNQFVMLEPGDQLDEYKIEGMIAHERGTTTFKAIDSITNREYAIEVPDPEIAADPILFERFHREQETKVLDHPGLIRVIEKREGQPGKVPFYMVKEWFEAVSLREILSKGKLPIERAIHITVSICDAVEFVHGHGIVFLDIEPEHVQVGANDEVKLNHLGVTSKFGARRLTFTRLSQLVGNSQYISPEELKGLRVDASSDIYSIGLMLYEMLTGRLPFQGPGSYDRLSRPLIPPREINQEISPQLQEVLYRSLEFEPRNRYPNAREFRQDLTHLDQVGVADRPELRNWKKQEGLPLRKLLLYSALASIPIAIFALLLYFAKR